MKYISMFLLLILPFTAILAQDSSQTFLSIKDTGVEEFINSHPKYDGRGTIIFILDTGVDMGIDGLEKTSAGKTKVIDVQDFSGEGDINLYKCETDEEDGIDYFINKDRNLKIAGADSLKLKSLNDEYYIGALYETKFKNSGSHAEDLNGNGSTKDKYIIISFKTVYGSDTCWVAYVDANDDGNIADDKPLRNYKDNYDTFKIPNQEGLPKMTFALNIFPDRKIVSLFYDDGAHGTHVSGIASGYHIGGSFLNGVAPGAQLIVLKIGNNNFSGGATVSGSMRKAFLYADKVSKEKKEPCALNMSFGIGSEIEGRSDMELFLDTLLSKNPYLYACISNGNDGPGISSSGLPASSNYVLSSGAVLPHKVGRDLFGSTLKKNVIFFFSSRGGEVDKPDICSPGICTSTVPNWERRDVMGGTSMASPYTTGVVSLILSAMEQEHPGLKIPSPLLFKAIRQSAVKMEGYTPLDEGMGYINVVKAYKLLKKYIAEGELKKFESYTISSFAPNMPEDKAPALYIRNGNYLTGQERYTFSVKRNNFQKKDKFYRIYNIKSDAGWLLPIQKKTYIRNNQRAFINVRFDKSKLSAPGLYVGRITATRDDRTAMPEFSMLATVVVPYSFCSSDNYSHEWNKDSVAAGYVKRYFIDLPAGQTSMHVKLSTVKDKYSRTRFWLFNPEGVDLYVSRSLNAENNRNRADNIFYNLKPGVYELDVESSFFTNQTSEYNLTVKFSGIDRIGNAPLDSLNNSIKVVNQYNDKSSYNLTGRILGYEKDTVVNIKCPDKFSLPFTMNNEVSYKEFTIDLSKKDFNKVTDFSIIAYDKNGKAVDKEALSYKKGTIRVDNNFKSDVDSLTLELIPAFSNADAELQVRLKESAYLKTPEPISVSVDGRPSITLYPSITKTLRLMYSKPQVKTPEGTKYFGKLYFESETSDKTEAEFPIYINF